MCPPTCNSESAAAGALDKMLTIAVSSIGDSEETKRS